MMKLNKGDIGAIAEYRSCRTRRAIIAYIIIGLVLIGGFVFQELDSKYLNRSITSVDLKNGNGEILKYSNSEFGDIYIKNLDGMILFGLDDGTFIIDGDRYKPSDESRVIKTQNSIFDILHKNKRLLAVICIIIMAFVWYILVETYSKKIKAQLLDEYGKQCDK